MSDLLSARLAELRRLADALTEARDEYKTLVANPESLSADIRRATRCCRQAFANFSDEATPEVVSALVALAERGAEDTALLDWMQEHAASAYAVMDMDPEAEIGYRVAAYDPGAGSGEGTTLRDAARAARSPATRTSEDGQ